MITLTVIALIVAYLLGFITVGSTEKGREFFADLKEKFLGLIGKKPKDPPVEEM